MIFESWYTRNNKNKNVDVNSYSYDQLTILDEVGNFLMGDICDEPILIKNMCEFYDVIKDVIYADTEAFQKDIKEDRSLLCFDLMKNVCSISEVGGTYVLNNTLSFECHGGKLFHLKDNKCFALLNKHNSVCFVQYDRNTRLEDIVYIESDIGKGVMFLFTNGGNISFFKK
ncbi:MAG: hypothetical protein ACRCZ9_11295 [Fusobacteriaceae bacterium]